ncbi:MAG: carbohydrate binding domain-containing protein, partial [Acidobacteria bacterium]|nr:carbohydrate binding domain-containing protein [Acidobacteriota bacterium]
ALSNTGNGLLFFTDLPGDVKLGHVYITDVEASGFGKNGIGIGAWNGKTGYRDIRIIRTVSHDNLKNGMHISGKFSSTSTSYAHEDVYIGYSRAYNNSGDPMLSTNSGSGIVISDVDGGIIEHSITYNNGGQNRGEGGPYGIWAWDSNDIVIQHNESYGNHSGSGEDGGGFDLDGGTTNSVAQYNYSHDNDGAGFLLGQFDGARPFLNNVVRYNISQNDGRRNNYAGIMLFRADGTEFNGAEIHNNVIYVAPSSSGAPRAVRVIDPTLNVHFRNNVFITAGNVLLLDISSSQSGMLFQNNSYWPSGGTFAIRWRSNTYSSVDAWRAATGQERVNDTDVGITVDPRLTSPGGGGTLNDTALLPTLTAYQLRTDSPLIDAGLDLASVFGMNPGSQDFFGSAVPLGSAFDIGAHELQGASVNLLTNPGFEEGATGWLNVGNANRTIVTSPTHMGAKALQMIAYSTRSSSVSQTFIVAPNTAYSVSGWAKVQDIAGSAVLKVSWIDSANQRINAKIVGTHRGTLDWTELTSILLSPTNAAKAQVVLTLKPEVDGTGTAWFDDIRVEP